MVKIRSDAILSPGFNCLPVSTPLARIRSNLSIDRGKVVEVGPNDDDIRPLTNHLDDQFLRQSGTIWIAGIGTRPSGLHRVLERKGLLALVAQKEDG